MVNIECKVKKGIIKMGKIKELKVLATTKFLSLYNARYTNKKGQDNNWIIASRKSVETLDKQYKGEIQVKNDAVVIVPFHEEEKKLVIIKQFRVPLNDYVYELPAGLIDENEDDYSTVYRELKEETGLTVNNIIEKDGVNQLYLSPGMTDESVSLIYCTCKGEICKEYLEADEDIEAILISREEAKKIIESKAKIDIKCYIILENFIKYGEDFIY